MIEEINRILDKYIVLVGDISPSKNALYAVKYLVNIKPLKASEEDVVKIHRWLTEVEVKDLGVYTNALYDKVFKSFEKIDDTVDLEKSIKGIWRGLLERRGKLEEECDTLLGRDKKRCEREGFGYYGKMENIEIVEEHGIAQVGYYNLPSHNDLKREFADSKNEHTYLDGIHGVDCIGITLRDRIWKGS